MDKVLLILEGADLVDGSGAPKVIDPRIVIDGATIVYAGPRTTRFEQCRATVWQVRGKTIIPGLIEAHTHAAFDSDMSAYIKMALQQSALLD